MTVVVLENVTKRGEPPIVVKPTFVDLLDIPQGTQRRGSVPLVRRAHRLELVDPDLLRRVQVPARLGEDWRDRQVAHLASVSSAQEPPV